LDPQFPCKIDQIKKLTIRDYLKNLFLPKIIKKLHNQQKLLKFKQLTKISMLSFNPIQKYKKYNSQNNAYRD
jgi:hypothetical protein